MNMDQTGFCPEKWQGTGPVGQINPYRARKRTGRVLTIWMAVVLLLVPLLAGCCSPAIVQRSSLSAPEPDQADGKNEAESDSQVEGNGQAVLDQAAALVGVTDVSVAWQSGQREGWDLHTGGQAGPNSLYGIGSMTKSFVAVLALILEQESVLSLDDSVGNRLPAWPWPALSDVTLRELLTMRSGLPDYLDDFSINDYFQDYTAGELIQRSLSRSAFSRRGTFEYANTNSLVARALIEQATGRDCEQLIREKILNPLHLHHTYFASEKDLIQKQLVRGLAVTISDGEVDFTQASSSWADLACGMYASASDMADWGEALLHSPLLIDSSRRQLPGCHPGQRQFCLWPGHFTPADGQPGPDHGFRECARL